MMIDDTIPYTENICMWPVNTKTGKTRKSSHVTRVFSPLSGRKVCVCVCVCVVRSVIKGDGRRS